MRRKTDPLDVFIGSTLPVKHGFFLLVKSKTGAARGLWNNSGGHCEENESLEECALRETAEETGYLVSLGRRIATFYFTHNNERIVKCVYETLALERRGGYATDEIEETRWFSSLEIAAMPSSLFTVGAITAIEDYRMHRFDQEYVVDRIP